MGIAEARADIVALARALVGPVLITGASGFIGSCCLRALLAVRDDVFGAVRTIGPRLSGIPPKHLQPMDVSDIASVRAAITNFSPCTILDCAAYGGSPGQADVCRIHQTNYLWFVRFLEEVSSLRLAAYVHTGSVAEYGAATDGPMEDAAPRLQSHYGLSKYAAAGAVAYYGGIQQMPILNLRFWPVYGPKEDERKFVPRLCLGALTGALPPWGHPESVRDQIHVLDAVRALLAAAVRVTPAMHGHSYNIGTGRQHTLREIAHIVAGSMPGLANPVFADGAPNISYANTRKAAHEFGYTTMVSFEEGWTDSLGWWREQRGI